MKIIFSKNLETIRKSKKISQEELAELIGVSRQTIYKWEADICMPSLNKIEKLLVVLNVSINELLNYKIYHKNILSYNLHNLNILLFLFFMI